MALKDDVLALYPALTFKQWDEKICRRGVDHIRDPQLKELESQYSAKIPVLEGFKTRLTDLPTNQQIASAVVMTAVCQVEIRDLQKPLKSAQDGSLEKILLEQQLGSACTALNAAHKLINQPEEFQHVINKMERIKEKFACVLKEQEFRAASLVTRKLHNTTYYMDFLNGAVLGLNYTFTNGSATVQCSGHPSADGLGVGDYIQTTGGTEWYKILSFEDVTDTVTITPVFQQANVGPAAANLSDISVANYGTTMALACVHPNWYTTDTVRTAGDILKVRANQSHVIAGIDITFDEDGTLNALLETRGCSVADDPWGDASNVKPIIDFSDTNFQVVCLTAHYWRIYRFEVIQSGDTSGIFSQNTYGLNLDACDVHDCASRGIYTSVSSVLINDCTAYSNINYNLEVDYSRCVMKGTIVNGGAATTAIGLYVSYACVNLEDCSFGATTTHTLYSVYAPDAGADISARNCLFADATEINANISRGVFFRSEDHDQVAGAQKTCYYQGVITRNAGVQLDGLDSALMTPKAGCGLYEPLTLSEQSHGTYQIWCAAALTTITIKARETVAWAADPTNAEFYFEASYLDGVSAQSRTEIASAQALNGIVEVSFTMTFTPNAAGWVYVECYLKKYEAGKTVNVSVKPVVT